MTSTPMARTSASPTPTSTTQLRWGADAPTSAAGARQRLVEAAGRCIERFGLAKTTLEDVAGEANVSRQTIYRYFADRDALLLEALITELEQHAGPDPSEAMLPEVASPEDAVALLVEGAVFTLESIRNNPTLSSLLATEGDSVRATLSGASQLLFRHHGDNMRPWLVMGQRTGFLNPDLDPDEMAEWLMRITLSLLTTSGPVERDADELRRYLTTYLTPVLAGPGRTSGAAGVAVRTSSKTTTRKGQTRTSVRTKSKTKTKANAKPASLTSKKGDRR